MLARPRRPDTAHAHAAARVLRLRRNLLKSSSSHGLIASTTLAVAVGLLVAYVGTAAPMVLALSAVPVVLVVDAPVNSAP